jgi:hypothetical protein
MRCFVRKRKVDIRWLHEGSNHYAGQSSANIAYVTGAATHKAHNEQLSFIYLCSAE